MQATTIILSGLILVTAGITRVLSQSSNSVLSSEQAEAPPLTGLVHWHEDFDAAKTAAVSSGRPVVLFQLLGNLTDPLC